MRPAQQDFERWYAVLNGLDRRPPFVSRPSGVMLVRSDRPLRPNQEGSHHVSGQVICLGAVSLAALAL